MTTRKEEFETLTKKLMDEGRLIAAGWHALESMILPPDAPESQRIELRKAFFAGAQHLFASIILGMDESEEPTDDDMNRVDLIQAELEQFEREFEIEMMIAPPAGSA